MVETPNIVVAKAMRQLGGELHAGVEAAQGRYLCYWWQAGGVKPALWTEASDTGHGTTEFDTSILRCFCLGLVWYFLIFCSLDLPILKWLYIYCAIVFSKYVIYFLILQFVTVKREPWDSEQTWACNRWRLFKTIGTFNSFVFIFWDCKVITMFLSSSKLCHTPLPSFLQIHGFCFH